MTDTKKTVQAETEGRIIALTHQQQRNDDLDAFRQILIGLVEGSAWAIESAVYTLLLANTGSFFGSGNKNLTDVDLSIAGYTAAEQLFTDQVSGKGKPIMSQPDRVLVGTQDGQLAQDLYGKSGLLAVDTNSSQVFVENPHRGKYEVIKTPYLNNTAIRTPDGLAISNQDSDRWYMLGPPDLAAAIILGPRRPSRAVCRERRDELRHAGHAMARPRHWRGPRGSAGRRAQHGRCLQRVRPETAPLNRGPDRPFTTNRKPSE